MQCTAVTSGMATVAQFAIRIQIHIFELWHLT